MVLLLDSRAAELFVNDISENRKKIKQYDAGGAQEILGIYLAPNGDNMKQAEKMKKNWQSHGLTT